MWFWRDRYFRTLREIGAEAGAVPEWADYAAYCAEQERGLRRQAFAILERFIARMEHAPFAERRRFVSWLLQRADGGDGSPMLVPHPLRQRIIEPTLDEWIRVEPMSSEPHRWLGGYEHLKRAVQLDPSDGIARRRLVEWILNTVEYATHELPSGYLGDAPADLALLAEAEAALAGLSSESDRIQAGAEIARQRELIEAHLRSHSGHAPV